MSAPILIGVDFSGDVTRWRPRCSQSNVWIAVATSLPSKVRVTALVPVQELDGSGQPFDRLSDFLNRKVSGFAAIDAPFSLPQPWGGKPEYVWKKVLELRGDDRPFAQGSSLISEFVPHLAPRGQKVLRRTEMYWRAHGINVRSSLWNGPRGGAPFAAACMTLLARHRGPVWPYKSKGDGIVLAEGFPAAQLVQWNLPSKKYDGASASARENRRAILDTLYERHGLSLDTDQESKCTESADALDAVLCLYAAAALAHDALVENSGVNDSTEGIIAVHR